MATVTINLEIDQELLADAVDAAEGEGMSLNAWIAQAIEGELEADDEDGKGKGDDDDED